MTRDALLTPAATPRCPEHGRAIMVIKSHPDQRYVGRTVHVFPQGDVLELGACVPCPDDTDGDGNCGRAGCVICGPGRMDA